MNQNYEKIVQILNTGNNSKCADCGKPAQWASVNHGIFLCIYCSGTHRSIGMHITRVRSVQLDTWTDADIQYMQVGGNNRFWAYLDSCGLLTKGLPQNMLYKFLFLEHYRKLLRHEVEGDEKPEELDVVEGWKMCY